MQTVSVSLSLSLTCGSSCLQSLQCLDWTWMRSNGLRERLLARSDVMADKLTDSVANCPKWVTLALLQATKYIPVSFSFSVSVSFSAWVMKLITLSGYCLLAVRVVICLGTFQDAPRHPAASNCRESAFDVAQHTHMCVWVCVSVIWQASASVAASAFATLKFTLIKRAVINFNFNQKFHLDFQLIDVARHLPPTPHRPLKL